MNLGYGCTCRDYGRDKSSCPIHNPTNQLVEKHTTPSILLTIEETRMKAKARVEKFQTGATRDVSETKIDYEGFYSPTVTRAFGLFMHYNRELEDGSVRASDNWQLGIPLDNYIKSLVRHVEDLRLHHRGHGEDAEQTLTWTLCAIMFNAQGYLHETLKKEPNRPHRDRQVEVARREDRRRKAKRMAEL